MKDETLQLMEEEKVKELFLSYCFFLFAIWFVFPFGVIHLIICFTNSRQKIAYCLCLIFSKS